MDLAQAAQAIVDRLTDAGVRASVDERDLNPPAVFVGPPVLSWRFGKGSTDATWTLVAVVPNTGRNIALTNLGALVTSTAAALGLAIVTARPMDLSVPDQAAPLPGYALEFTQRIPA